MTDPEQVQEIPDRREAIEAAFEAVEAPEQALPAAAEPVAQEVAAAEEPTSVPTEPAATPEPVEKPTPTEVAGPADRAPQSWKAPLKAKWDKLDPEVRQEVLRRERETTQVLNDSAQARQLVQQLAQTIQPYQARIKQIGAHPIEAMGRLLKADQFLSSAPPADRAKYMATLIKGYSVDIAALDAALADTSAGAGPDPVASRVEQLLTQRLQPFQSFIQQQQQREKNAQAEQERQSAAVVEQMAKDPKYPHFEAVRGLMADLIDFSASKGQTLTIEAAYNRAIALDSSVSQLVANETASKTLAASTIRAKRALNASASVSGTPGGIAAGVPNASDRRATIEAALSAAEGR